MRFIFLFICLSFKAFSFTPLQRIAVISDLNNSYGSTQYGLDVKNAITSLIKLQPDVVLSTGDMVAGQKAGLDYKAMWSAFHEVVTIPLRKSNIPFAVTVGNHDGSAYAKFANERSIYAEEFKSFKPNLNFSDDSNYPLFYSFEIAEVLFLSIDSTLVGPLGLLQMNMLEKELNLHASKKVKVVFTHVPLFHFAQVNENESFFDLNLVSLLERHGVNLYLSGHHHSYYPGFYNGIHYVSQGCLGAGATKLVGKTEVSPRSMTMIEIFENHFEVFALKGPNYTERINHLELPASIESKNKILILKDKSEELL